jgi:hypothetical protein
LISFLYGTVLDFSYNLVYLLWSRLSYTVSRYNFGIFVFPE